MKLFTTYELSNYVLANFFECDKFLVSGFKDLVQYKPVNVITVLYNCYMASLSGWSLVQCDT